MKKLLSVVLAATLAVTSLNQANALSLSDAASKANSAVNTAKSLSGSDTSLLKQIASNSLSTDKLVELVDSSTVNSYVKNSAVLSLAQKYITSDNLTAAKSVLSKFNSSAADASQNALLSTLKSKLGL